MSSRAPRRCAALALWSLHAAACTATTDPSVDASPARDARPPVLDLLDAPRWDAPPIDARRPGDGDPEDAFDPRLCVTFEVGSFGSACREDGSCDGGLECGSGVTVTVAPLGGGAPYEVPVADGFCTMRCAPGTSRPCGSCGVCVTSVPFGTGRVSVMDDLGRGICVQPCWPDVGGGSEECNGPYGCDRLTHGCVPACTSDADCSFTSVPGGTPRFTEVARTLPARIACGHAQGECMRDPPVGPTHDGDPCTTDFDCAVGATCIAGSTGAPGRCATYADCAVRGCGPIEACVALDDAVDVCAAP